jgi:hypothetical protein
MLAPKKIRLDSPAIREILIADSDSESGSDASEDEFYEFEEEEQDVSAQEDETQAATSGGGLLIWGLPQGRNLKSVRLLVQQMA